ncbi:MAG: DUF3299 domain-containing protein [Planctomycetota bacterium]|nr:DUF3299 domain-containing protein [Planctomycetota bacterium]
MATTTTTTTKATTTTMKARVAATRAERRPGRWPAMALSFAALQLCTGCGEPEGGTVAQGAAPASSDAGEVSEEVKGRSFLDISEGEAEAMSTAEASVRARAAARTITGVEGLAGSVDPAMLTPEALAENPLRMGTVKSEPFELAEGADPLDPASYDWAKDAEGHWVIGYGDLSLAEADKDLLLDALVYPEEYEGEDLHFPDRIRALDGQQVALTGYMIPLRWDQNKVPHFMLVRDLLQCCFGGAPEPDEWVDVDMAPGGTTYWAYVPVVVRGTFKLAGQSDEAGYATGAFAIKATDAHEE